MGEFQPGHTPTSKNQEAEKRLTKEQKKQSIEREKYILENTKSRTLQEAEFLKTGAEYVFDEGSKSPRLHISDDSLEKERKASENYELYLKISAELTKNFVQVGSTIILTRMDNDQEIMEVGTFQGFDSFQGKIKIKIELDKEEDLLFDKLTSKLKPMRIITHFPIESIKSINTKNKLVFKMESIQ